MSSTTLHTTLTTISTAGKNSFGLAPAAATAVVQRSPWHSPVPYLFGGLAAMLGLIAFALLILACSYWKLSRENENQQNDQDLEKGEGISKMNGSPVFEEKIVVIMAGNDKPTFLATPAIMSFTKTATLCTCDNDVTKVGSSAKDQDKESSSNDLDHDDDNKPKEDHDQTQTHN